MPATFFQNLRKEFAAYCRRRAGRDAWRVFAVALAVLCAALLAIGLLIAAQVNHDAEPFDQGGYIGMSQEMQNAWTPSHTDGTRNPLFPWLAAKFFDARNPNFLEQGKKLNVLCAVLGTAALGAYFRRRLGSLAAWNLAALSGLGCLLPIATFFGGEVLFYLFFFGVWAVGLSLLRDNLLRLYALLGLWSALAWLAKPSTSPFLGLLFGWSVVLVLTLRVFPKAPPWLAPRNWKLWRLIFGGGIFALIFFTLLAPRLLSARATYGSAFYSLPSYWFWLDDWETCTTKFANCTQAALEKIPREEWPTAVNYFRTHSLGDAVQRLAGGTKIRLQQLLLPEKQWRWKFEKGGKPRRVVLPYRGLYLAGSALLAAVLLAMGARHLSSLQGVVFPALLAMSAFAVYTLAYGWYEYIGPGHRFIMMLYIPLIWTFLAAARRIADLTGPVSRFLFQGANVLCAVLLIIRLAVLLLPGPAFEKVSYAF